jgi:hypothetical protein
MPRRLAIWVLFSPWRSRYWISTSVSTPIILACSLLSVVFGDYKTLLLNLEQAFFIGASTGPF